MGLFNEICSLLRPLSANYHLVVLLVGLNFTVIMNNMCNIKITMLGFTESMVLLVKIITLTVLYQSNFSIKILYFDDYVVGQIPTVKVTNFGWADFSYSAVQSLEIINNMLY